MSFIFRAYHAMARQRPMSTKTGIPTSATFVFVNMLRKLRADFAPEYLAAVFDVAAPTFRDEQATAITSLRKFDAKTQTFVETAYGGYKANRAAMPDDLAQQVPYIRRALEAYRIPMLEASGFEADDVIGTLARKAVDAGYSVFVVSSDKDMMQLVSDRICVLNPPKDNLICDAAKVEEILGVPPEKVVDVMALRGDTIDNIPGAPGIGDKGSVELIQRFGSVEQALDHAAEVEQQNVSRIAAEQSRCDSYRANNWRPSTGMFRSTLDPETMAVDEPDAVAARDSFSELEFTSLLRTSFRAIESAKPTIVKPLRATKLRPCSRPRGEGYSLAIALERAGTQTAAVLEAAEDEEAGETEDADDTEFALQSPPPLTAQNEGGEDGAIAAAAEPAKRARGDLRPAGKSISVALASAAGQALSTVLADPEIPKAVHDYKLVMHVVRR